MEAPPKRAHSGGAESSEESCIVELRITLSQAPPLRRSKTDREWSSITDLKPQDGGPLIVGPPQPRTILEDIVDRAAPQRLYHLRYCAKRQTPNQAFVWSSLKHPAVKVKEDYRWPQSGEPEWRFRVWKWSDNNVPLLSDGREYYLASLWYCGESVPPPPLAQTMTPAVNSNKQRHEKQGRLCFRFNQGEGMCFRGACCDFRHDVPDKYQCELDNTQVASAHFLDFHCAFCGRLIASAVNVYRINKGDVWARGLYNCKYLEQPVQHNIFKAMPTRKFACVCRFPAFSKSKLEHGYYAPEMKLFKLFLFSRKADKFMFYWKPTPSAPLAWRHEPLRSLVPDANITKRVIEKEIVSAGLAGSIDEATERLNKMELHEKITKEQHDGNLLPPPLGCPLCLRPDVERPVMLCDCLVHHMCQSCGAAKTTCPVCPGPPDTTQIFLWPDPSIEVLAEELNFQLQQQPEEPWFNPS